MVGFRHIDLQQFREDVMQSASVKVLCRDLSWRNGLGNIVDLLQLSAVIIGQHIARQHTTGGRAAVAVFCCCAAAVGTSAAIALTGDNAKAVSKAADAQKLLTFNLWITSICFLWLFLILSAIQQATEYWYK